nr:DNA-deoxyinosine glycosylase [Bittarella massiliensis (ex Durand et al. 2017)]
MVEHTFLPVWSPESEVLILGTIPSPKSRENGFYYGHPQNRFWRVVAGVLGEPVPEGNAAKEQFCLRRHIALWDVLAACEIEGAADATIRRPRANDIAGLLQKTRVRAVFTTGAKAHALYQRHCLPQTGVEDIPLPSTSPANARFTLERLIAAYRPLGEALEG